MRLLLCAVGLTAVAACAPRVPDSAAGVGFGDYGSYQAEKEARAAELAGTAVPGPDAVSQEPLDATGDAFGQSQEATPEQSQADRTAMDPEAAEAAEVAAEARATLEETAQDSGVEPVQASPSNPPPETVTTPGGISAENDFEAVGEERSIEADARLIERNRERYQVIEPEALPPRPGGGGPNIVAYALQSQHPPGTQLYTRIGFNKQARFERNCAKYPSADKAQEDFLKQGGPQRDRLGLDPDGDGYACGWDPRPFRRAVQG